MIWSVTVMSKHALVSWTSHKNANHFDLDDVLRSIVETQNTSKGTPHSMWELREGTVSVTVRWSTIISFLLVLGCINADFCVQGRIFQRFSRSTYFPSHHSRLLRFFTTFAPFFGAENSKNLSSVSSSHSGTLRPTPTTELQSGETTTASHWRSKRRRRGSFSAVSPKHPGVIRSVWNTHRRDLVASANSKSVAVDFEKEKSCRLICSIQFSVVRRACCRRKSTFCVE